MDNSKTALTRRQLLTGGAAAVGLICAEGPGFAAPKRPNFVFILTDDQRWDAMRCAGNSVIKTPNMDRLAREGAHFKNAFVTTALCSPSRASFLTGQYVHTHGVKDNQTPLPASAQTFPKLLHDAGYRTAYIGKWHMDGQNEPQPGFDHWVSFQGQGRYDNPMINVNGTSRQTPGYMTDILNAHAVKWLSDQTSKKPFCLYLSHKAVHGPFTPAERHKNLYSNDKLPVRPGLSDDLKNKPQWLQTAGNRQTGTIGPKLANTIRNYYRTLAAVDEGIGQVLQTLESRKLLDNTVVIFCGDNGYLHGEHGLGDKRAMYEESIRIPMLMRYPALIKPATMVQEMALNIDIAPTILDLAGVGAPSQIQGRSLKSLLKSGGTDGWRQSFIYEYFMEKGFERRPTVVGVRTERYKLAEYPDTHDLSELYDLRSDPHELNNLISDPGHAAVLTEMRRKLKTLKDQTGYTIDQGSATR